MLIRHRDMARLLPGLQHNLYDRCDDMERQAATRGRPYIRCIDGRDTHAHLGNFSSRTPELVCLRPAVRGDGPLQTQHNLRDRCDDMERRRPRGAAPTSVVSTVEIPIRIWVTLVAARLNWGVYAQQSAARDRHAGAAQPLTDLQPALEPVSASGAGHRNMMHHAWHRPYSHSMVPGGLLVTS